MEGANKVTVTRSWSAFVLGKLTTRRIRVSFASPSAVVAKTLVILLKKCPVKVQNPESGEATWKPKPRSGKKKKTQQKVCFIEET